MIEIYFDGGCLPKNPGGVATYGYLIYEDSNLLHSDYGVIGVGEGMTNNVAEYTALLQALRHMKGTFSHKKKITVYGDSQLVLKMVGRQWGYDKKGQYLPHKDAPHLRAFLKEIHDLMEDYEIFNLNWIPREKNKEADKLTRLAYKDYQKGEAVVEVPFEKKNLLDRIQDVIKQEAGVSNFDKKRDLDVDMLPFDVYTFKLAKMYYRVEIKLIGKKLGK